MFSVVNYFERVTSDLAFQDLIVKRFTNTITIMDIGTNAGVVWRALFDERQGMTLNTLMSRVNLPMFEVAAAVGWLARENKIWISGTEDGNLHLSVYHECYY